MAVQILPDDTTDDRPTQQRFPIILHELHNCPKATVPWTVTEIPNDATEFHFRAIGGGGGGGGGGGDSAAAAAATAETTTEDDPSI